jgi:hypothetical protein
MPERFEVLARYNSERWRGVAHTPEWDALMARIQADYDRWIAQEWYPKGAGNDRKSAQECLICSDI